MDLYPAIVDLFANKRLSLLFASVSVTPLTLMARHYAVSWRAAGDLDRFSTK